MEFFLLEDNFGEVVCWLDESEYHAALYSGNCCRAIYGGVTLDLQTQIFA